MTGKWKQPVRHITAWLLCGPPLIVLILVVWIYLLPGWLYYWWTGHGVNWPTWAKAGEAMVTFGRKIDAFADRIGGNKPEPIPLNTTHASDTEEAQT